jgi:hypothetical protein
MAAIAVSSANPPFREGPMTTATSKAYFTTRGIVLTPDDISLGDWPERAAHAGLTTIALHPTPSVVAAFIGTDDGRRFLKRCSELGIEVEYELHAMSDLLPRTIFDDWPELFRADETGMRLRDGNLCVSSERALEVATASAVRLAAKLRPTSGRYFLWGDDGVPWCRCRQCRHLSDSDQALLLSNHLARALRKVDRRAKVAHLAYHNTLAAPSQVKPERNVFLEFAPIHRRYDIPFEQQRDQSDTLEALDANLELFEAAQAQVLEYWMDASRFAGWKRPSPRLPWSAPIVAADLDAYGSRGIRHVTSFGVYLDLAYVREYGQPPVEEYGSLLCGWAPRARYRRRSAPASAETAPDPAVCLTDPYRERLLHTGSRLPELMEACADPLHGDPAFDPALVWRIASLLSLPGLSAEPVPKDTKHWKLRLAWAVRVGLAHIYVTFRGVHPKYGTGAYADERHDGFPPTIIAAVDALVAWGMRKRAETLFGYWLRTFVAEDGTIRYYAPSLSEYGQLLTTVRRLLEAGTDLEWLSRHLNPVLRLAHRVADLTGPVSRPSLPRGIPEADTASDAATYFHNAAWLWRGLTDWSWILGRLLRMERESEATRMQAVRLQVLLLTAIRDTWPRDRSDWWLRPMTEPESGGAMARPVGRVTASRLGSYTNYRYWPELLSSGVLPDDLMRRVVDARLNGGGQWLGMTPFDDHADNWPLMHYLDALWSLRMRSEYAYVLWGHILFHQARGHYTAYEQVSLPPGASEADYCLPCQLVAVRAARRLL